MKRSTSLIAIFLLTAAVIGPLSATADDAIAGPVYMNVDSHVLAIVKDDSAGRILRAVPDAVAYWKFGGPIKGCGDFTGLFVDSASGSSWRTLDHPLDEYELQELSAPGTTFFYAMQRSHSYTDAETGEVVVMPVSFIITSPVIPMWWNYSECLEDNDGRCDCVACCTNWHDWCDEEMAGEQFCFDGYYDCIGQCNGVECNPDDDECVACEDPTCRKPDGIPCEPEGDPTFEGPVVIFD